MEAPACRSSRWARPEQLQGKRGHCPVPGQGTATAPLGRNLLPQPQGCTCSRLLIRENRAPVSPARPSRPGRWDSSQILPCCWSRGCFFFCSGLKAALPPERRAHTSPTVLPCLPTPWLLRETAPPSLSAQGWLRMND